MAFNTQHILRDAEHKAIPQKWNEVANEFTPFTGGVEIQNGFRTITVGVGSTATTLGGMSGRRLVVMRVSGDDAVFIGSNNSVSVTNGFPILPGHSFLFHLDPMVAVDIYAIADSSQTVHLMEVN